VNTREGNRGKPSTKLTNEAHMRPAIVGCNNSTRPKTMSSSTFIKTFKVLPLVKWGKSDVENNVMDFNLNCPENNSPEQRPDFMHLLEP
jgi:hypothetical protein